MAASSSSEVRPAAAGRRIVDYLNDGEELGAEGAVAETPPCTPAASAVKAGETARALTLPRFRWPRLVRHGLRRKGGRDKGKQEEVVVVDKGDDDLPVPAAASTSGCQESSTASDNKRQSDLGVGLSLVFLLAKTSDEFNKMVKVRTEMEALLKDIRDEVRIKSGGATGGAADGHDEATKDRTRESTTSSCVTTDGNGVQSAGARMEYHQHQAAASSGVELAGYEKSLPSEDGGGCCARMDVLEEEFHAEMDLLQVNYGSETPSFLPDPEEEEEHYSEPYDEMADYRNGVDDDSGGVVEDDDDGNDDDDGDDNAVYNGVSAMLLERRLHELLHERNRERIEELEAALRCAEQKLVEKEMEVSLWKDTAKFALRQDKELQ